MKTWLKTDMHSDSTLPPLLHERKLNIVTQIKPHEHLYLLSLAGMLHGMVGFLVDVICCRFQIGIYKPLKVSEYVTKPC